jgi:hypothetical protein
MGGHDALGRLWGAVSLALTLGRASRPSASGAGHLSMRDVCALQVSAHLILRCEAKRSLEGRLGFMPPSNGQYRPDVALNGLPFER